jgi:hypothetical protein
MAADSNPVHDQTESWRAADIEAVAYAACW